MKDYILEKVLEKVYQDGDKKKIKCEDALLIAKELKIAPVEVGKCCNKNEIKVSSCQLGCFK